MKSTSEEFWQTLKTNGLAARQQEEVRHHEAIHTAVEAGSSEAADAESAEHRERISEIENDIWIADSHLILLKLDTASIDRPSPVHNADWWEQMASSDGKPHSVLSSFGKAAAKQALSTFKSQQANARMAEAQDASTKRSYVIAILSLVVALTSAVLAPIVSTFLNAYWPTAVDIIQVPPLAPPSFNEAPPGSPAVESPREGGR